ncbi:MAG: fibronectin type III domain-containing protein [Thermodesulfobacteriota bacterium]
MSNTARSNSAHGVFFLSIPFFILGLAYTLLGMPAYCADITLAWDANIESDLAGYKVYYKTTSPGPPYNGTGAREGDSPIDVGNQTRITLHDLSENDIYFITVTAYNDTGLESGYSDEVNTGDDDLQEDSDEDGLITLEEYAYGTDPHSADTDQDGLPDGWEVAYGLDPTDSSGVNGAEGDPDSDGWCNYEEYLAGTDPTDISLPEIIQTIPHQNAGVNGDSTRVPCNTSFSVRIEALVGIDTTDAGSITFIIDDGLHEPYQRDLSDDAVVRVVPLTDDENIRVTELWVSYDRSRDDKYGNCYPFDGGVGIQVAVRDRNGKLVNPAPTYQFHIESQAEHDAACDPDNLPETQPVSPDDPDLQDPSHCYDAGIEVAQGELAGTKIIYCSSEPIPPRFGLAEFPALNGGCGEALNLEASTVFATPVTLFIPCPLGTAADNFHIYLYKAGHWVPACDNEGRVLQEGEGWILPGSRVDHNDRSPGSIQIEVYYFSPVQLSDAPLGPSISAGPGGGCFIDSITGDQ